MKNYNYALMVIAVMAMTIMIPSCDFKASFSTGSEQNDSTSQSDTLWNDSVQSVFFDTPFGASAQEVVDNFAKYGFIVLDEFSDSDEIVFGHKGDEYYNFEDMKWVNLTVDLTSGKFSGISFYTPRSTKDSAEVDFKNIVATLSKKYKLTNVEPEDSSMYMIKRAYTKLPFVAGVGCYSYTDEDNKTFYTASLDYNALDVAN